MIWPPSPRLFIIRRPRRVVLSLPSASEPGAENPALPLESGVDGGWAHLGPIQTIVCGVSDSVPTQLVCTEALQLSEYPSAALLSSSIVGALLVKRG